MVASYPFDDSPEHKTTGLYSKTSDDEVFRYLAKAYASNHPIMKTGEPHCPGDEDETFKDGITNGAHWYDVEGMQSTDCCISFCWFSFLTCILNAGGNVQFHFLNRLYLCMSEVSKTTAKFKDDHRNMYYLQLTSPADLLTHMLHLPAYTCPPQFFPRPLKHL